jgi:cytochrome c oxidase assembly protein subunit 15
VAWASGRRGTAALLFAALFVQIQLGILTLLSGVEIQLGVAHQAMAALLLGAVILTAHRLGSPAPEAKAAAAEAAA